MTSSAKILGLHTAVITQPQHNVCHTERYITTAQQAKAASSRFHAECQIPLPTKLSNKSAARHSSSTNLLQKKTDNTS
jgi:hypothetical protein